eukprot:GHVS01070921.1.p2 GENE.GHVS01070921.1~~GHVS01070921.1.p2  ORF type:complete len:111 (+),score=18.68 GHVS01070921.1:140-472(+)
MCSSRKVQFRSSVCRVCSWAGMDLCLHRQLIEYPSLEHEDRKRIEEGIKQYAEWEAAHAPNNLLRLLVPSSHLESMSAAKVSLEGWGFDAPPVTAAEMFSGLQETMTMTA